MIHYGNKAPDNTEEMETYTESGKNEKEHHKGTLSAFSSNHDFHVT